ncbi:ATP-grasp domain-containing protein [Hoylesella buccalis]|uniref:ATP-grasp domain-containing protein n=1 Tax=Hoylesella buccalis TaxID=28127 RepID=UPI00399256AD
MLKNKRLMILGTNEYQNPLIIRAKELGYETHVFGWPVGEIGEKTANVYHPINILDYDLLWEECQKLRPCGVASICSELAMHPMNMLLRKMGIPCNSHETEDATTNKYKMRVLMRKAGLDSPRFMLVTDKMTIDEIRDNMVGFHYPLIIKPVDLSSSRGVEKIDDPQQLEEALAYSLEWSKIKQCILEEFIEGPEYSGESIAYEGKYKLLAITEKHTTGAPHFVETGHRQPAHLSPEMQKKVERVLYRAFESLGIQYGAIHPEFRITPDGKIIFMEIATRMGGDCIGTDLTPLSSGYDFMGMVIKICCGKAPDFQKIREPMLAEIRYIMNLHDMEEFKKIKRDNPDTIWRYSSIKELNNNPVLKSADRAGYYITIKPLSE